MKLTDRQLRELLADQAATGPDPDPELLRLAARGELPDHEREQLVDRLIESPAAAQDYRLARALEQGPEKSRGRFARAPFALAAILVLGIGAGLYVGLIPEPAPRDSLRGESAIHPPDGALLDEPPVRLDWPAVPGALRYRVLIVATDGTEVWRSDWVATSEIELPAVVRAGLEHGQTLIWTAAADAEENRPLATPYRFSVR